MSNKVLYQFTVDKEVEIEKETKKVDKKTGEETIIKKKTKEKVPVEVQIMRPTRRQLEEADLEYSVEIGRCVKKGILTKAMLAKKYNDTGGLFSETDADQYGKIYKSLLDHQNEYVRLDSITAKTPEQEKRFEVVKDQLLQARKDLVDFESSFQSLFDHTADIKAQNKVLLWYALHLTYIYDEFKDAFIPYFEGDSFEEKTNAFYAKEEAQDPVYFAISKKVSTVLALWFFNHASSQEEFTEMMSKIDKGEV